MKMRALLLILSIVLTACGTLEDMAHEKYKTLSSSRIGCATNEIETKFTGATMTTSSWIATCKGQKYYCQSRDSLGERDKDVSCTAAK